MRKRISVCMLAAMMSVTSMYSFAAQGAENETEQETGIEQESETQAEEAVDPMSADQILMRARKFEVSEILNAYFGEGKWDENLITSQESLASERNEYDGENRKLWIVQTGVGFLSITITYKDEVPDEKVRLQEGEDLLQTLNINIMDEYMKQTDFVNDDRSVYTYYLQQDGIKISPEGYSIGSEGDETEYYGQFAKISMEDNGYMIMIQKASEVVGRESISERQQISDEDAILAVYDAVWNGLQIPALQTNPIADSLQVEVQYIPVDMGTNKDEYVYDIGLYVKQMINPDDGSDQLWYFTGLVDATMPYCYTFTMAADFDDDFQTEYLRISDRELWMVKLYDRKSIKAYTAKTCCICLRYCLFGNYDIGRGIRFKNGI